MTKQSLDEAIEQARRGMAAVYAEEALRAKQGQLAEIQRVQQAQDAQKQRDTTDLGALGQRYRRDVENLKLEARIARLEAGD